MIVELIAQTTFYPEVARHLGYRPHLWTAVKVEGADELAELAGRECYQSWARPNPETATNIGYLNNILKQGHHSVLEHASFTFSVREVSRALTHELVRHRHLSFSQVSQRYVDESDGSFVLPPEIVNNKSVVPDMLLTDAHQESLAIYEKIIEALTRAGVPRKRARQAARAVLPNGHATRLIVSGNVRAWREMITKRGARNLAGQPLADLEMFQLAEEILSLLHVHAPNSVQDLWERKVIWDEMVQDTVNHLSLKPPAPGETPATVEPDDARPQPMNLA